jgi:hypothetical protein
MAGSIMRLYHQLVPESAVRTEPAPSRS